MKAHHTHKALLLFCLCMAVISLASCMRTYKRCYEHAFATDGVYCEENAVYRIGGKEYAKGQQTALRNVRYRSWENFYEWYHIAGWEMKPIPGTEGDIVYREVRADSDGKMEFTPQSKWVTLQPNQATHLKNKNLRHTVSIENPYRDRHLTWRGVYALPAAAACFAVEAPFNVVSVTVFLIDDIIGAAF